MTVVWCLLRMHAKMSKCVCSCYWFVPIHSGLEIREPELRRSHCVVTVTFQPLTSIDGVNDTDVPYYRGLQSMADYCPVYAVSRTNVIRMFLSLTFRIMNRDRFINAIPILLLCLHE